MGGFYDRARSAVLGQTKSLGRFSLTVATSLFIQVITVASGVILARALGPEGRGDLAVAMLWPTLVSGVGMLGIADALTFRSALERPGPSAAFTNALFLATVQSLFLGALGWVVVHVALYDKPQLGLNAQFYLWYIPLNLLTLYPAAALQGRMMLRSFNLIRASVNIAYTACLAVLWAAKHIDITTALAASLFANAFTLFLCSIFIFRGGFLVPRLAAGEMQALLSLGVRLHLGNVAFLLASRIDIVVLSFTVPSLVLGEYVVAAAVGALPLVIPSAAGLVLYPLFARRVGTPARRAFARFIFVALAMTLAGIPVVILMSPLVVQWFFGRAFLSAITTAKILGLASLVRGMSLMASAVLRGLGAPIRASGGDVAGLVVIAICIVPGIRLAQGNGAAVAVLLGTATALSWMGYHGMRVVGLSAKDLVRSWAMELEQTPPQRQGTK